MKISIPKLVLLSLAASWLLGSAPLQAQQPAPPAQPAAPAPSAGAAQPPAAAEPGAAEEPTDTDDLEVERDSFDRDWNRGRRSGNEIVSVGHDSVLRAGEKADAVISVFGSSTSAGEVSDAVVSVLGNTHVTGPVGDSVVAVFGDVYLNSKVRRDVVSVLGSIELGPQAEVGGDVVSVFGGAIKRDAAAVVHGGVNEILGDWRGLRPWIEHCLFYMRPLALEPGLGWAWGMALGFLAFYILLALMFREGMDKCLGTFDARPGQSMLAALLTMLLSPVVIVVLCITVIGVILVPFLAVGLFAAQLFGKAVVLAWIGRRCLRSVGHTAVAVVIGGAVVLALYLVPVVGFLAYNVTGLLGLGIVVYTLILGVKETRRQRLGMSGGQSVPGTSAVSDVAAPAMDSGPMQAPTLSKVALPRAGFWIRVAALAIDALLIGVVLAVIDDSREAFLPILAIYGALMWKLRGTTIGGIICNLQVVRLDGRDIDWATAAVRALSCFLSLIVAGLGFIWIALDPERQAWHDKIAGTIVVRAPQGGPLV